MAREYKQGFWSLSRDLEAKAATAGIKLQKVVSKNGSNT